MMQRPEDLLAMRYRLGGRGGDGTIDCLGVVLCVQRHLGRALGDVWATVGRQWIDGGADYAHGFPAGWRRLAGNDLAAALVRPCDGDVWLHRRRVGHDGVGCWWRGRYWSALPETGPVSLDLSRAPAPTEVWRC